MQKLFRPSILITLYRGEKNLKEVLSPSLFPLKLIKNEIQSVVVINAISVRIILYLIINFLSVRLQVECTVLVVACLVTALMYFYITFCKKCGDQYSVSVTDFKTISRVHKGDIKTNKDRCGAARHVNNKCYNSNNPHIFIKI